MADNQDALDAIDDIVEAVNTYGSDIKIGVETETLPYDPYVGHVYTTVWTDTKALIGKTASTDLSSKLTPDQLNSYEKAIKIYSATEITKEHKIQIRSEDYNITVIDVKELQNTILLYELLIAK